MRGGLCLALFEIALRIEQLFLHIGHVEEIEGARLLSLTRSAARADSA